jgi:hypothetical protein
VSNTKYDARDIVKHIAEGRHDEVLRERAAYKVAEPNYPTFLRFVIIDVIHDPAMIDSTKLSHYEHDLHVANIKYATVAPRNSIIARRVMGGDSKASEKTMLLFPFCPPHLAMPAKPGEHVWGMLEHPDAKINDIGYWMWKITQPDFVEDVNYTHADRQYDASFLPGLSDVFEGTAHPKYEFHNGAVDKDQASGDTYVIGETSTLNADPLGLGTKDPDKAYTDLLQKSDATQLSLFESVPRYRKRPADTVFEGSNNTLIVLGTDRSGPASNYKNDPQVGQVPQPVPSDATGPGVGAIDLIVGRGQTTATGGTPVDNTLGTKKEIGKDKPNLSPAEGDVDRLNDRSTFLIAQKTKVDTNFKIDSVISVHTKQKPIQDTNGEGAIVVKTDKIRLIARHDVVILVSGADQTDPNGNVQDPGASIDPSKCSSLIIRVNGDIVFTPSDTGLIRLGGDDASLSPLCTRVGNSAGMAGPVPPPTPIVDTMGGAQGGADGTNGTFPLKVLMK